MSLGDRSGSPSSKTSRASHTKRACTPCQGSQSSSRLRGEPAAVDEPSESGPTPPLLDPLQETAVDLSPTRSVTSSEHLQPTSPMSSPSAKASPMEAPLHLNQTGHVQRLLAKVPDVLKKSVTLDPMGRNFNAWFNDLKDAIETFLGIPLAFTADVALSHTKNTLVRSMIRHTVDPDKWALHRRDKLAKDILANLTSKYFKNTCSSHLALWKDLLAVRFQMGNDNLHQFCSCFSKLGMDLKQAGFVFNDISVLGVLLQLALPTGNGPFRDLSRTLDALSKTAISFQDVMNLATAKLARFKLDRDHSPLTVAATFQSRDQDTPAPLSMPRFSTYQSPARPTRPSESRTPYKTLVESDAAPCFWCLKPGHWANSCESQAAGLPMTPRLPGFEFRSVGAGKREWQLCPKAIAPTPSAPRPPSSSLGARPAPTSSYPGPSLKVNAVNIDSPTGDNGSLDALMLLWEGALTLDSAATES